MSHKLKKTLVKNFNKNLNIIDDYFEYISCNSIMLLII